MNRRLLTFLLLLFISTGLQAQNDSVVISRNIKALQNYALANPIEKVHLHLDTQLYFPGDTIWFKAYVVLGEYHKLSALSGILYAELIDPKDSVVKRLTLKLQNGTAPGDFELLYNIEPGAYRIRAYTNWMRNAGPEYFYDQSITVASFSTAVTPSSTKSNASLSSSAAPDKIDLQFFPEGGDLVNGLRSKVAFKAINQNGLSEQVQGTIVDNDGNEVATFNSQHLGMGAFPLEPQKGKQYTAKGTAADGSSFTIPLPQAKNEGFVLSVNNNTGDSLLVKIAAANVRDSAFYLIAQCDGKYYFAASHKLNDQVYTTSIPKSRFPSGVVQLTLFSQNGEPLNERVVFIQNNDQLNLTVTTDKPVYASGEKVKMGLEVKDQQGNPVAGTFSVSVIDESRVPVNENAESTIFTDLLLRSELAGYIEEPNYYFINPNEQTRADLDLLMLTQGYRRFEWKKILSEKNGQLAFQPEQGFTLSGTVKNPVGKPIPKGEVILTSPKNLLVMDTLTDDNGKFAFNNIMLTDTATLIINSKKANGGANVKTMLDKPVYPPVTLENNSAGYVSNHFLNPIQPDTRQLKLAYTAWKQDSVGHVIQLKEVKIKDHKIPPFHPDYSQTLKYSANLNGPGNANQVFMAGDDLLQYDFLVDAIRGKLYDVKIGLPPIGVAYSLRASTRHLTGQLKPMAIYVNGAEVEPTYIDEINPADVYSIEVLTSAQYLNVYGTDAIGGALIITLKNGSEMSYTREAAPGLLDHKFRGFYKARDFYSPKYDEKRTVSQADNRKTIYWNPYITAILPGKASLDYFTAGNKGNYRVVIEGIDLDGKFGRQILRYKVDLVERLKCFVINPRYWSYPSRQILHLQPMPTTNKPL